MNFDVSVLKHIYFLYISCILGGVFERNEVFNNRFDGICLATGVNPKMIENSCHDNKRALNEAIEAGKCLYQVSGSVCYPMHDFYR